MLNNDDHMWDYIKRHNILISEDGKIIVYHGTRNITAQKIRNDGFFRSGTFFTPDYDEALTAQDGPMGTSGSRKGRMIVMKVKIDPRLVWLGVRISAKQNIPFEEV